MPIVNKTVYMTSQPEPRLSTIRDITLYLESESKKLYGCQTRQGTPLQMNTLRYCKF
jgi:hypothetical protein